MAEPLRLNETHPHQRGGVSAVVVSVVLHVVIAIALAMIVRSRILPTPIVLEFSTASPSEVVSFNVDSSSPSDQGIPQPSLPRETPIFSVVQPGETSNSVSARPENPMKNELDRPGINFFGASASGDHFIFILDNSFSMGARKSQRYQRACEELLRSVGRLRPNQSYSVFLFSWETAAMYHEPSPRYRSATGDHLSELRQWVTRVSLGPGTDPRRALALASYMKPDAVFLLTDGDFNQPDQLRRDTGWVTDQGDPYSTSFDSAIQDLFVDHAIPIHTIAYENPFTNEALKRIAEQSGGTFRYVKTDDHRPIDYERFEREKKIIDQRKRQALARIRSAKKLMQDGELAMAQYLLRPVDAQQLVRVQDRETLDDLRIILSEELGDVRLEDFTKKDE